jgi:hypothetical protein
MDIVLALIAGIIRTVFAAFGRDRGAQDHQIMMFNHIIDTRKDYQGRQRNNQHDLQVPPHNTEDTSRHNNDGL